MQSLIITRWLNKHLVHLTFTLWILMFSTLLFHNHLSSTLLLSLVQYQHPHTPLTISPLLLTKLIRYLILRSQLKYLNGVSYRLAMMKCGRITALLIILMLYLLLLLSPPFNLLQPMASNLSLPLLNFQTLVPTPYTVQQLSLTVSLQQ